MAKLKVLEVIRQGQIGGGESHLLDLIYFLDKEKVYPFSLSFFDGELISRLKQMENSCYMIDSRKSIAFFYENRILKEKCEILAWRYVIESFSANRVVRYVTAFFTMYLMLCCSFLGYTSIVIYKDSIHTRDSYYA